MYRTGRWTGPVYVLFFVLSGAELDLRVFASMAVVGIGLVYIITRSAGKIIGANVSSRFMGCQDTICKYLGIIRNIVLFSVLIYGLVGPVMTKMALSAAGEITPKTVSNRGVIPTDPHKAP